MKRLKELRYFEQRKFLKRSVEEVTNKLAGLLTGYELDVIREGRCAGATADDDDVELTEFSDEIEDWVEEFAKIDLDTAKKYLKQDVDDLVRRTDLERKRSLDVMSKERRI
jgi:N utilization substance protein A